MNPGNLVDGSKRPPSRNDDCINKSSKKRSKSNADLVLTNVMHYVDEDRSFPNRIGLSKHIFTQLNDPKYVKIGRFVFPAHVDKNLCDIESNFFELNKENVEDALIQKNEKTQVWISNFNSTKKNTGILSSVHFSVTAYGKLKKFGNKKEIPAVSTKSILREIKCQWKKPILKSGQNLFLNHPVVGPIYLEVDRWDFEETKGNDPFSALSTPTFGTWNKKTEIEFVSSNTRKLTIFDEIDSDKVQSLKLKIIQVREASSHRFNLNNVQSSKNAWKRGVTPTPFSVPFKTVCDQIHNCWNDTLILPGKKLVLREGDWKYTIKVTEFKIRRDPNAMDIDEADDANQKAFQLDNSHALSVTSGSSVLLTKNANSALFAKELTFKIEDYDNEETLERNEIIHLSVEEVAQFVREIDKPIAEQSKIVIHSNDKTFLLSLSSAKGDKPLKKTAIKSLWKVDENTEINVFSGTNTDVEVVDQKTKFKADTLHLKVSIYSSSHKGGILEMLMGGSKKDAKKENISEKEIIETFIDSLPIDQSFHEKIAISGTTNNGIELDFKIDHLSSCDKGQKVLKRGCIYKVTNDTKITIEGEKNGGILIDKEVKTVSFNNVENELIKRGIGGLTKPIKEAIQQVILSRHIYKDHIRSLGVTPQRGFLLYGPPGTGKTKLARVLGDILNISKDKIQFYSGSDVLDKYVGESEKKVREMFEPAREDQKLHGDNSPTHMLIIDEIDAILGSRSKATKSYRKSIVETFLTQLDGISSTNQQPLDNIIVVGLTNFPDTLDKAVTRDGRLGVHIHLGLPNQAGRKEIFEIHARKIIESGYVSDDVDYEKLATLTSRKTGSFIEAVVKKATLYHLPIVHALGIPQDELSNSPETQITMANFLQAIDACINSEKVETAIQTFAPSNELSVYSIADDLKQLGLVGIPKPVRKFLFDIKLAEHYQADRLKTNQELPKGVLLYGPPGTGKSSLGRSIGKLLGLDRNQFQHYSASQLLPKGHTDLREILQKKIQPAKDAAKDLEGEAPLHVVVIDELEWLYKSRVMQKDSGTTLMAQFMREISTLFHNDGIKERNLIVIGIAQYSEHSELIKSFNLGSSSKLVAFGYPEAKARKEIFCHYLNSLLQAGRVDKDSIDSMVSKTDNKSGAFIEKMVKEAVSRMYRRCVKNCVLKEEIAIHKDGRITHKDLDKAYRKIAGEEKWKESFY